MNILHLEDNDTDAELFEGILFEEWPYCRITRMWSRREFEAALQMESYDLILSDYSMPGFDGLAALEIARVCTPDTPFIFLSGTIGEERAIEAMKGGASDYVLKGTPARLIASVRGALADAEREAARRRAEDSLRKNREQFRQIAESIDDFIVLIDTTGRCLYSNPAFTRLLGKNDFSPGLSVFSQVHPEDAPRFRALFDQVVAHRASVDVEYRVLLPEGSVRYLEARIGYPHHRSDSPTILLAGRDVTARKQAEETLHEQASLLGKARDAVCLLDLQFTVKQWNASAERIYGVSAARALGRNIRQLLFQQQTDRFDTAYALTMARGEWQGEFRFSRAGGPDLVVDSSWSLVNDTDGRPKSILCIDTDVTDRRQLELELQRSQRIEGLGMLAGGIAHDLNNILSPILMSVGLLRPLAKNAEDKVILDTLEASAGHGTDLVRQILLFARGEKGQRSEVRIGQLIDELRGFLKTTLRRAIDLQVSYAAGLWPVFADATQLKQVVMNLCVNARDAMPQGGCIKITASNLEVAAGMLHSFHGEVPAGRYTVLSVADSGTGIPPDVLEKIFDPFFTTKEVGKGTGLGLSTIAGIVQDHEGAIRIESAPGRGTTFHIYLPALAAGAAPTRKHLITDDLPEGSGETVLIIDDDEGIRMVTEKILEAQGYAVLTARDGTAGLEEFHRHRDTIQAVICDQTMPGLLGQAVLEHIRSEAPHIGLILMSGQDFSKSDLPERNINLLPKPLTSEMLLQTVREAIDAAVAK